MRVWRSDWWLEVFGEVGGGYERLWIVYGGNGNKVEDYCYVWMNGKEDSVFWLLSIREF